MAASWGPVEKPTGRDHRPLGEEGAVTLSTPASFEGAPRHDVRYDATDSRHGHERDMMGWPSIDHMSGPVTDTDWDHSTGHFPDGPGVWRQT